MFFRVHFNNRVVQVCAVDFATLHLMALSAHGLAAAMQVLSVWHGFRCELIHYDEVLPDRGDFGTYNMQAGNMRLLGHGEVFVLEDNDAIYIHLERPQ